MPSARPPPGPLFGSSVQSFDWKGNHSRVGISKRGYSFARTLAIDSVLGWLAWLPHANRSNRFLRSKGRSVG